MANVAIAQDLAANLKTANGKSIDRSDAQRAAPPPGTSGAR
jgi:hypothetical protein